MNNAPVLIAELANGKLYQDNFIHCNECNYNGTMEHDIDMIFYEKIVICPKCGIIIGTMKREAPETPATGKK